VTEEELRAIKAEQALHALENRIALLYANPGDGWSEAQMRQLEELIEPGVHSLSNQNGNNKDVIEKLGSIKDMMNEMDEHMYITPFDMDSRYYVMPRHYWHRLWELVKGE
jgi:hypothetical protein